MQVRTTGPPARKEPDFMNEKAKKTNLVRITARTDEEMQALIDAEQDETLRTAYTEMLQNCRSHPKKRLWYTCWRVTLVQGGQLVGNVGFLGEPNDAGEVELGYGTLPGFCGNGYATEAVRRLTDWAFSQPDVFFVRAQAAQGNAASRRVLEKAGFEPAGTGREGLLFELEKPKPDNVSIYMSLGLAVGVAFGTALNNLTMGLSLGLAIGVAVGSMMDGEDKKKRQAAKLRRQNR